MQRVWCLIVVCAMIAGCGSAMESGGNASRKAPSGSVANSLKHRGLAVSAYQAGAIGEGAAAGEEIQPSEQAAILERKIVYEAELSVVVEEFAKVETSIPKLVRQFGGYLAEVDIDRTQGEYRSGKWEARVPVDRFDAFLDAVSALGVPERRRLTAQDVTEEFVDLEARIANKQRLEKRIVELLNKSDGDIKDIIEVERELGRVRGDIEQMQGRLRYLADRTTFTTVTVLAREERDYVPPAAPSFAARIGRARDTSLRSLRTFGEGAVVTAAFSGPWLVVLGVVLIPPAWYLRRMVIKSKNRSGEAAPRR